MREIPLTRGYVAIVDDDDAHLAAFRWHAKVDGRNVYAARSVRQPDGRWVVLRLHRVVLAAPAGTSVDHVNGDGLDNRRSNLRSASKSENGCNRRIGRTNTSGFKGVSWNRCNKKWLARIKVGGRDATLGYFSTAEVAAHAYDAAALKHYGAFARLNFPALRALASSERGAPPQGGES